MTPEQQRCGECGGTRTILQLRAILALPPEVDVLAAVRTLVHAAAPKTLAVIRTPPPKSKT